MDIWSRYTPPGKGQAGEGGEEGEEHWPRLARDIEDTRAALLGCGTKTNRGGLGGKGRPARPYNKALDHGSIY